MAHEHEGNMVNEFETESSVEVNLDNLKCLQLSEAVDQYEFLQVLAKKHNELVAFLAKHLAK